MSENYAKQNNHVTLVKDGHHYVSIGVVIAYMYIIIVTCLIHAIVPVVDIAVIFMNFFFINCSFR